MDRMADDEGIERWIASRARAHIEESRRVSELYIYIVCLYIDNVKTIPFWMENKI